MSHPIEKRPKKAGVWNIRDFVVKRVGPVVDEYAEWYAEHGVSLPASFEFDPTGWTEVLRRVQRAFYLAGIEQDDSGEFYEARQILDPVKQQEVIDALKQEVVDGFRLFGKHLNDFYDKYGPDQAR